MNRTIGGCLGPPGFIKLDYTLDLNCFTRKLHSLKGETVAHQFLAYFQKLGFGIYLYLKSISETHSLFLISVRNCEGFIKTQILFSAI